MIEVLTRKQVLSRAPEAWANAYADYRGQTWQDKKAITEKLQALKGTEFTEEDVNAIIGNSSWTSLKCEECGREVQAVAIVGGPDDASSSAVCMCKDCLIKAVDALGSEIGGAA